MPNRFKQIALGALAGLLTANAAAPREADSQPSPEALRALDERVLTVGHRLAVAGRTLCASHEFQPGFAVHDLSQYGGEERRILAATGLGEGPGVLALVPGGPAAEAGLRRDDVLLDADGEPLPRALAEVERSFEPTERIIEALERAFADGRARLTVRRSGVAHVIDVEAAPGCASRFQVVPSDRLNALADGRWVQMSSAMAAFAADDEELAGLIAHELAHNILRHRSRLNQAGIDRGLLQHFGRNARLTRATEIEADRFAVYLLARAGFDPRALIRLWSRLGPRTSRLFAGTHPRWRERIAVFESEITEVERLRAAGQEIRPAWAPGALD